jgi:hypothetical protein
MMPLEKSLFLLSLVKLFLSYHVAVAENMNQGEYMVANSDTFETEYKDREYFDVYSNPIKSLYSQVHWKSHGHMSLPEDIVKRFSDGKLMAITGYEVDQVRRTESGEEVSVPITWAYNHHYITYILNSKKARLVKKKTPVDIVRRGMNHGAEEHWEAEIFDVEEDPSSKEIPQVHMFSEGNGGEMRLSYHGYPKGYAQIIESPDTYIIAPMQIDTWNRNMKNATFRPGPLPRSSRIPAPEAGYSGLLECPCTDRIDFEWSMTYAFDESRKCTAPVQNASECFTAVQQVIKSVQYNQKTVSDKSLSLGCSGTLNDKGDVDAVWNSNAYEANGDSKVDNNETQRILVGVALGLVNLTVAIDETKAEKAVHLKLTGPGDKWFGVGFGSDSMCLLMQGDECPSGGPYAVIVSGDDVTERKLDFHGPGVVLSSSMKVESNQVENGFRTVHLSRPLKGPTPNHYTFDTTSTSSIPLIMATGCGPVFAQHCGHGPNQVNILPLETPKQICQAGIEGTIGGVKIKNDRCAPFPESDLRVQENPTCNVETYVGGIHCCPHGAFLLDSDQEIPWQDQPLEYNLKFRFYFEEFKKPTSLKDSPSHQQLIRPYWQTEAHAGEYDIVQCKDGTPPSECVQVITSRWKVRDMMIDCPIHDASWCTGKGSTKSSITEGIKIIYIGPHCHAGSCLSMELYNADTGRLLCGVEPKYGKGQNKKYDEHRYLAIPPCLWGNASEGLPEPELLSLNTTLLAIKRNNNTLPHTGEMASWQMRAIVVRKDIEIEMEEEFSTSMEPQLRRTWVTRTKKRKADETSN